MQYVTWIFGFFGVILILRESLTGFHALARDIYLVDIQIAHHFGPTVFEGAGEAENEGYNLTAIGVDIAPEAVLLDGSPTVVKPETVFILKGDYNLAGFVAETHQAVFLDRGKSVVEKISVGAVEMVVVFDRQNGMPPTVDDAILVSPAYHSISVREGGCYSKGSKDLPATGVKIALKVANAIVVETITIAYNVVVAEGGYGLEALNTEEGKLVAIGVADYKDAIGINSANKFVFDGNQLDTPSVDDAESVVFLDYSIAVEEGIYIFVAIAEADVALLIYPGIFDIEGVDIERNNGQIFAEGASCTVLRSNSGRTILVEEADKVVLIDTNHAFCGIAYLTIDTGHYLFSLTVDKATLVIVAINETIVTMPLVDKHILRRYKFAAVCQLKAKESVALGSLDAVYEIEFTSARLVVDEGILILGRYLRPHRQG